MSNIDTFLNKFVDFQVKKRGQELYSNAKVLSIDYSSADDTWMCIVEGSRKYITKVKGLSTNRISTSCTCDYNWGPVCKHAVATLFAIDNYNENDNNEKAIKRKASFKQRIEGKYPITKYKSITREFVFNNSLSEFHSILYVVNNNMIRSAFINDNTITVQLSINNKTIRIRKISGSIYIQSDELMVRKGLKQGEAIVLMLIAQSKFSDILDTAFTNIDKFKKASLKDYGLTSKVSFDDYFKLSINLEQGLQALPTGKLSTVVIPNNKETRGQNKLDNLLSEINQNRNLPLSSLIRNSEFLLGFVIQQMGFDENSFLSIDPIQGKANKGKTKLASRYTIVNDAAASNLAISENQKDILGLIDKTDSIETNIELWENINRVLRGLHDEKFVYYKSDTYAKLSKSSLLQINVSDKFASIEVDISTDEMFLIASMKVNIDNKMYNLGDIDLDVSNANMVVLRNDELVLYPVRNYEDGVVFQQGNHEIRMSKKYKANFFDQVISPLSKKFNINFEPGTYNVDVLSLDFTKRQIYLSEEDKHLMVRPMVVYDGAVTVDIFSKGNIIRNTEEAVKEYKRNFDLEEDFLDMVSNLHPHFAGQRTNDSFYLHYDDFMKEMWFYNFFEEMKMKGVEVFGLKDLKNFKYSPFHANISTGISTGIDWFEVDVKLSFGDNIVSIKDLKKAIINKQKFIKLNDGSVGILPSEWFAKLNNYFRQGEIKDGKLEISKLKFSVIDELFDNIDDDKIIEEIAEKRRRIAQFSEIKKVKVPKTITANMRDYQKEGLNWLNFLDEMDWGGILADDMGLGKTLQILAFMQRIQKKNTPPSLIVIPTTLLFNWENEIAKFAPKLKAHYHYGPQRARNNNAFVGNDLVFTTYGILLRDIEFMKEFRFNYIVLDESQYIKNPHSRRFKSAMLINARNRIALTGTPIENSTFDLFAQMNFVNPGFFGGLKTFQDGYSIPIDKDGDSARASELQRLINPFVLRRTKEKVATELPAKTEGVIYCQMDTAQRQVYDAYRNRYKNELMGNIEEDGLNKSKIMVLKALTRLRQICDAPSLINNEEVTTAESVKVKEILKHITSKTANHKVLVFSQFVGMLSLIRNELNRMGIDFEYLDGKSTRKQREESVNNFQENKELRVFLISMKAGGTGLNLTAADYVYIMDPWWNPAVENQAIDRCYRIGQDKKVFAYRMICENTVEEKIMELQAKKRKIATDIIQTDESIMKNIDMDDIKSLFG
ncbi:MAG: hypothetical protein DRI86_00560 [Bacteroidetes bacterium]|nr:MAG: hypothetical protein DRI86_00560 [Bacteroidota bacterium]